MNKRNKIKKSYIFFFCFIFTLWGMSLYAHEVSITKSPDFIDFFDIYKDKYIIGVFGNLNVNVWDFKTGKLINRFQIDDLGRDCHFAISQKEPKLTVLSYYLIDNRACEFSFLNKKPRSIFKIPRGKSFNFVGYGYSENGSLFLPFDNEVKCLASDNTVSTIKFKKFGLNFKSKNNGKYQLVYNDDLLQVFTTKGKMLWKKIYTNKKNTILYKFKPNSEYFILSHQNKLDNKNYDEVVTSLSDWSQNKGIVESTETIFELSNGREHGMLVSRDLPVQIIDATNKYNILLMRKGENVFIGKKDDKKYLLTKCQAGCNYNYYDCKISKSGEYVFSLPRISFSNDYNKDMGMVQVRASNIMMIIDSSTGIKIREIELMQNADAIISE